MITYGLANWADYSRECSKLWPDHYDESVRGTLRLPLSHDDALYEALERIGSLMIMVARSGAAIVGYMVYIVRPHSHCVGLLCAFEDRYYLQPAYRRGRNALNLIKNSLRFLKERGVQRAFVSTPAGQRSQSRLLEFIGLEHVGNMHSVWIGD